MTELRAGVDRPGGATAEKPVNQRGVGDHRPPIFGEPPKRTSRLTAARRQIQETVIPAGLIDPEPELPGEVRKPLEIGDMRSLDERIIGYEEYQPGRWRPSGTISADEYTLSKIVERHKQAPLYRWSKDHPNKPTTHVYIRPLGHGKGWERVEKER